MDLGITGKVAMVTGGTKGIGSGITTALAQEGAVVVAVFRSDPNYAESFAEELTQKTLGRVIPMMCDVTDHDATERLFDRIREEIGPVDILVNNAAGSVTSAKPFDELTYEQWEEGIEGVLSHMFTTCRRFVADCRADKRPGYILNLAAKAAITQNGRYKTPYVAAKGGVIALTRSIAKEVTGDGIYCNCIAPGYVLASNFYHPGDPDYEEKLKYLPTGRFVEPIEIGRLVAWLCSPMNTTVIGAVVDCSAGTML